MTRDALLGWVFMIVGIAILGAATCYLDRPPVLPPQPTATFAVIVLPVSSPSPTVTAIPVPPKVDRLPTQRPTATQTSTPVPPTATETPTPNVTPPTQKG